MKKFIHPQIKPLIIQTSNGATFKLCSAIFQSASTIKLDLDTRSNLLWVDRMAVNSLKAKKSVFFQAKYNKILSSLSYQRRF